MTNCRKLTSQELLESIDVKLTLLLEKLGSSPLLDPTAPVNVYGESFTDAIQNGLVRGQKGISTYDPS